MENFITYSKSPTYIFTFLSWFIGFVLPTRPVLQPLLPSPVCNQWNVLLKRVSVQRKNTPELMNDGIWCELIVCASNWYGYCVNPLGIARGQSHSNFMLFYLETLLIDLFISWGVKPFSGVKIRKISVKYSAYTGCLSLYIYCDNM